MSASLSDMDLPEDKVKIGNMTHTFILFPSHSSQHHPELDEGNITVLSRLSPHSRRDLVTGPSSSTLDIKTSEAITLIDSLQDVSPLMHSLRYPRRIYSIHVIYQALTDASLQQTHDPCLRRGISKLLMKLVAQSMHLPPALLLRGVRLLSHNPEGQGGYADVFKGIYQGKEIALKRFRTFSAARGHEVLHAVSPTIIHLTLSHEEIAPQP
jgi:hypothetical protein